jgi:tetratricopeptide (TPR) repeat protein
MRRPRVRLTSWKLLIPLLIGADLLALWVWAARPASVYSGMLGLAGRPEEAPIHRLVTSALEEDAPWTPTGFVSLFEPEELFFASLLLFPLLVLLLIPLAAGRADHRLGALLSSPLRAARAVSVRFKVRTALAAIAVLALYLGWEINGWRSWRVRSNYLRLATTAARYENENLAMLQSKRAQLARLKKSDPSQLTDLSAPAQGFYRSKAARAAEQLANQDRLARETESLLVEVAAFAERRSKYERAAAHPWRAVEPDRALPEPPRDADYWLGVSDYERALAAYDEMARTYPDFVDAHSTSAWIRATCPDARFRNGKIAVASATRACELTNWQDAGELSILAAAFAEAGDFTQAVRWQQKVIGMIVDPRSVQVCRNRLAMFMAAEPYRQK